MRHMPSPRESEDVAAARLALGRQLASLRKAAGYTQAAFAPLTCYGRSTLANVETGRQAVPRSFWERCAEQLAAPGLSAAYDELQRAKNAERMEAAQQAQAQRDAAVRSWRAGMRTPSLSEPAAGGLPMQPHDDDRVSAEVLMRRRTFLRYAETAGIVTLLPMTTSQHGSSPELMGAYAALTANYRRIDALAGPGAVLSQMVDHQRCLADWLHCPGNQGQWRRVADLLADATILLAWLYFDLERFEQAAALYRQCLDLADGLGDANLRAFLTGRISRTLSEQGRHHEALTAADTAEHAAKAPERPELRSWLAVTRAYIHACLGDEYRCRADIEHAQTALTSAAPAEPPPAYLAFYGPAYLRKWTGHALLKLGSTRPEAIADGRHAIDRALESWSAEDIRESGEVLAASGHARLAQHEIPEAAWLTGQAYHVATATSSPRILRYATDLRRSLEPWRSTPAVRDLDDLIGARPGP